jgi:predicted helicase
VVHKALPEFQRGYVWNRDQVKTDKKSGIKNDPNDWATEVGNPRYILDLLLSIINVSIQTNEIVRGLPRVSFE